MSSLPGPAYHFRTESQWRLATSAGTSEALVLDPRAGEPIEVDLGCRPALLAAAGEEMFAVDSRGSLVAVGAVGPCVGTAERLIVGRDRLWLLVGDRVLQVDRRTLQPLFERPIEGAEDVAANGEDGLWLLAGDRLLQMDSRGRSLEPAHSLSSSAQALAFAGTRLAWLEADRRHLGLADPVGWTTRWLDLRALSEDGLFSGAASLDAGDGLFLVRYRRDPATQDAAGFLLVSEAGDVLARGSWLDERPPALLAAAGKDLIALFRDGETEQLLRFRGMAVPGGDRRMTPLLETESPAGTWHRADVEATLPERASLSMRWAATDDAGLARRVEKARQDESLPPSQRLKAAAELLDGLWSPRFSYSGEKHIDEASHERFAFPLHAAAGPFLWIEVEVRRGAALCAPRLRTLRVVHEAHSLIEDLPGIYRAGPEEKGGSPARRLVGVLEAETQELDERIGRLAERLDPGRADAADLPDLASLLSLPFHEVLSETMRRDLVKAAPEILAWRGTRRGVEALLRALFPGRPIIVSDRTELLIPMTLGRGRGGRALPALLSGPSARVPRLGAHLILGRTGLCRAGACDALAIEPVPEVLVTVPATGAERRTYAEGLAATVEGVLPAGVRLRLRWTPWRKREGPLPDDLVAIVDTPELLAVGQSGGLGSVRLGGRRDARFDVGGTIPASHRLL